MSQSKDTTEALNLRRAYTTGGKLGARQMFVFNEDGTISGLKTVKPAQQQLQGQGGPEGKNSAKDKKFGKISSQMSVSAMSVAESKVAFSDANYMPQEGQAEGARIGKMRGKPGVTIWNLLLVPGTLFFSLLSGADVMQAMTQILKNDAYYPCTNEEAGRITANSLTYAQAMAIPLVLVIGFLFDIFGRRLTTAAAFLTGAIATFLIPVVAPSIIGYDIVRILFVQTLVVMLSNPFINDYVTVQSRGIATGFQMIGLTMGNLISVGGLFTLTELIEDKIVSYGILAGLQIVWAVLVYLMVTEPNVRDEKEEKRNNKKSFCGKLWSMLKQAKKACIQDPALLISLIALMPSRNTANLQQSNFYIWIASEKFGLSPEVQKLTWQKQNIISNALALPQVFLIGRLSDKVSPKILVPSVLIFQIIVMIGYMFCQDPTSWYAYTLSAFQGGSGFMIIVAMQGYAVKRVPKMIRGIIMALIISLSGIGGIIYLQISKVFFESAPNMVFGVIGLFDALALVFIVIMIALGKYGDPAPQEDTFEEGNSIKKEDQTADFQKDEDYMDGDIPDVPLYQDIYNEQIPEMSSDREASSFHTKRHFMKNSRRSGKDGYGDGTETLSEEDAFIGSIRQTDYSKLRNSHGQQLGSGIESSRATRLVYVPPGEIVRSTQNAALFGRQTQMQDEQNTRDSRTHHNASTVNRSSSDEERETNRQKLLITERVTQVPRSTNKVDVERSGRFKKSTSGTKIKRKVKRSASFENSGRPTLIQELLAGGEIREESAGDETD